MIGNLAYLDFVDGTLTLNAWSQAAIDRVFGKGIWKWDSRIHCFRSHAIHYPKIREIITQKSYGTMDRVMQCQSVVFSQVHLPELREEQQSAVNAWNKTGQGVVIMPTGTGKTEVALRIMADQGCSTLVVAPIRDLMYQWHRRILAGLGYNAGVIGDNTFNVKPISVTTYDSACIHMPCLGNRYRLIVFDECHHLPGPIRRDAAQMCAATKRLGLTATLERGDGMHTSLAELVGPTVYRLDIDQAQGSSLAAFDIFRISVNLTERERARYDPLSEMVSHYVSQRRKKEAGFTWQTLCAESKICGEASAILRAFREKQSIENRAEEKLRVLEELFRLHHGSRMIVFAGSNAMARDVAQRFLIPCLLSHCGKKERAEYLNGLRDGIYHAIVANQVLDEGVDLPEVKIAVVIGGMACTRQAKQRLGRILRRCGTERAILYEVVAKDTNDTERSRQRRKSDAYARTRHRRI